MDNRNYKETKGGFFSWLMRVIGALLLGLFVSVLVEWIGMIFNLWSQQGYRHAQYLAEAEFGYMHQSLQDAYVDTSRLINFGNQFFISFYFYTMQWTGIESFIQSIAAIGVMVDYFKAMIFIIKAYMAKITIIVLSIPIFVVFIFWGFVEGLVKRDLRKFGADYEKGFRYHLAKRFLFKSYFFPLIIYLANPFTVNPAWIFIPFALVQSGLVMTMATNFNKYS